MAQRWPIVSVEQMRALEALAGASGLSEAQLQANAAAEIARTVEQRSPRLHPAVVLVGPGNNGRDAFLAGRLLAAAGREVRYVLGPRHAMAEDELRQIRSPLERLYRYTHAEGREWFHGCLVGPAVVLDGLLGIGVRGALRAPLDRLARELNTARRGEHLLVVSVDVPSGIDADTGDVAGEAVRADVTVALGALKAGTLRFPAAALVGRSEPRPIGLPAHALGDCRVFVLDEPGVVGFVPVRPLDAHKATLGWTLVLGGSRDYVGAPILSASAAARVGCGLVALAVPPHVQLTAAGVLPEATYLLRDQDLAPELQAERLLGRLKDFRAVVVGPGLGRDEQTVTLVRSFLAGLGSLASVPATVIDADALYVLAGWSEWWRWLPPGCVLTPHHGEMARLTGTSVAELGKHAWEIAGACAAMWQQIVVLKGAHTVVGEPGGEAYVFPRPNPALATAGTGDVLAGLIGGLAAQGVTAAGSARLAVVVHALAGEAVVSGNGWRSLLASDLLSEIPAVLAELIR